MQVQSLVRELRFSKSHCGAETTVPRHTPQTPNKVSSTKVMEIGFNSFIMFDFFEMLFKTSAPLVSNYASSVCVATFFLSSRCTTVLLTAFSFLLYSKVIVSSLTVLNAFCMLMAVTFSAMNFLPRLQIHMPYNLLNISI